MRKVKVDGVEIRLHGVSLGRVVAGCAALFVGITGTALAQNPPLPDSETLLGSRIPWRIERPTVSQRDGIRTLFRFATCTVRAKPVETTALMRVEYYSRANSEIVARLIRPGTPNACLREGGRMGMGMTALRGSIANALYLRNYPAFPADRLPAAPETAGDMLTGHDESLMLDFGRCVVRSNPRAVDVMLRTQPASEEEHEALAVLAAHFPPCLFQGQNLATNALGLRSILAEAAYRLSVEAAAAPTSGRSE